MGVEGKGEGRCKKKVYEICFMGEADSFRQLSRPAGKAERAREGDTNCRSSKRPQGVREVEDLRDLEEGKIKRQWQHEGEMGLRFAESDRDVSSHVTWGGSLAFCRAALHCATCRQI
jgi:hypothetical protein